MMAMAATGRQRFEVIVTTTTCHIVSMPSSKDGRITVAELLFVEDELIAAPLESLPSELKPHSRDDKRRQGGASASFAKRYSGDLVLGSGVCHEGCYLLLATKVNTIALFTTRVAKRVMNVEVLLWTPSDYVAVCDDAPPRQLALNGNLYYSDQLDLTQPFPLCMERSATNWESPYCWNSRIAKSLRSIPSLQNICKPLVFGSLCSSTETRNIPGDGTQVILLSRLFSKGFQPCVRGVGLGMNSPIIHHTIEVELWHISTDPSIPTNSLDKVVTVQSYLLRQSTLPSLYHVVPRDGESVYVASLLGQKAAPAVLMAPDAPPSRDILNDPTFQTLAQVFSDDLRRLPSQQYTTCVLLHADSVSEDWVSASSGDPSGDPSGDQSHPQPQAKQADAVSATVPESANTLQALDESLPPSFPSASDMYTNRTVVDDSVHLLLHCAKTFDNVSIINFDIRTLRERIGQEDTLTGFMRKVSDSMKRGGLTQRQFVPCQTSGEWQMSKEGQTDQLDVIRACSHLGLDTCSHAILPILHHVLIECGRRCQRGVTLPTWYSASPTVGPSASDARSTSPSDLAWPFVKDDLASLRACLELPLRHLLFIFVTKNLLEISALFYLDTRTLSTEVRLLSQTVDAGSYTFHPGNPSSDFLQAHILLSNTLQNILPQPPLLLLHHQSTSPFGDLEEEPDETPSSTVVLSSLNAALWLVPHSSVSLRKRTIRVTPAVSPASSRSASRTVSRATSPRFVNTGEEATQLSLDMTPEGETELSAKVVFALPSAACVVGIVLHNMLNKLGQNAFVNVEVGHDVHNLRGWAYNIHLQGTVPKLTLRPTVKPQSTGYNAETHSLIAMMFHNVTSVNFSQLDVLVQTHAPAMMQPQYLVHPVPQLTSESANWLPSRIVASPQPASFLTFPARHLSMDQCLTWRADIGCSVTAMVSSSNAPTSLTLVTGPGGLPSPCKVIVCSSDCVGQLRSAVPWGSAVLETEPYSSVEVLIPIEHHHTLYEIRFLQQTTTSTSSGVSGQGIGHDSSVSSVLGSDAQPCELWRVIFHSSSTPREEDDESTLEALSAASPPLSMAC
eukprot:m.233410 g.233410  ORF g.233410 m.233410 type:complete len:1071 (+) comp15245_c1_seq10:55-3267(+)